MKNDDWMLDEWLSGRDGLGGGAEESWNPGFEGERRVVVSRLGPYNRVFVQPSGFVRRFFHKVYDLSVSDWQLTSSVKLYGGFCTIDTELEIRFQPTFKYVKSNQDVLSNVNQHIKTTYEGLIRDAIDQELLNLGDGDWIRSGLNKVEKRVETAINEILMIHNIQCRTICAMKPSFKEWKSESELDGHFAQESIYLSVLKKNYEFREKQELEKIRQQEEQGNIQLESQKRHLEQANREAELKRQEQAQEAKNHRLQLIEHEQQKVEEHEIEQRLFSEKITYNNQLKSIERTAELEEQEKEQIQEQTLHAEKLRQKRLLEELELEQDIKEYEKQQKEWNETKERLLRDKLEQQQKLNQKEQEAENNINENNLLQKQQADELLLAKKIEHESRLKEMKLEADIKNHEKRYATAEKTDEYLRREIELLVLEKQRAELIAEIKISKHQVDVQELKQLGFDSE